MPTTKKVFISFAVQDKHYRDFLVGQAKNNKSPFEFTDMSVKKPWDASWKTRCRARIKGCDGLIALMSKKTLSADGARWEIKCANEEGLPILGIYCQSDDKPARLPSEISGYSVRNWSWKTIEKFIDNL